MKNEQFYVDQNILFVSTNMSVQMNGRFLHSFYLLSFFIVMEVLTIQFRSAKWNSRRMNSKQSFDSTRILSRLDCIFLTRLDCWLDSIEFFWLDSIADSTRMQKSFLKKPIKSEPWFKMSSK